MKVLNAGCGGSPVHRMFDGWEEVRLDIDPAVKPDITCDILDSEYVSYRLGAFDAVYCSHVLEHLAFNEVPAVLNNFHLVLRDGGFLCIGVPNLQKIAIEISQGNLEGVLYESPAGPVSAIDCVYGFRPFIKLGNSYYAHKTGFTPQTLADKLKAAGFGDISVELEGVNMWISGVKDAPED